MQSPTAQQILPLIALFNVTQAQSQALLEKLPKIHIEAVTQEEANLYLTLYFLSNVMPFENLFSGEIAQKLHVLRQDIAQYLDILPRIAQGAVGEEEMEHYMMKKMHQLSWAKVTPILASQL